MGSTVVLEKSQAIWRLTLNRPEKRNALNQDMKQALMSALKECDSIGPEVLIISGAGDTFCAGQDLNERKSQTDFDLEASIRDFFAPLAMKIRQLECVTVASVSGSASGAGASIALLCDIVVASKDARFIQPFLKLGIIPDMGGTWVLPRLIGEARARGAILLGDPINGEEAADWGLIWKAVEKEVLDATVDEIAERICQNSKKACSATKAIMHGSSSCSLEDHFVQEAHFQGQLGRSDFYRAAVERFFEKKRVAND